jgi:ribosomal protein L19
VELRKKFLEDFKLYKGTLMKFKERFNQSVFIITRAPKFNVDSEGVKKCIESYTPMFDGVEMKQKLELTAEEAYSFSMLR